ncbi:DUF5999 family protein [Streptomyces jumonjinensis]|uniref:DUF5999 family protein n=1 Tax=Streptomyces jumonjinensis TaxID=1945 RepID=UPI0037BD9B95
MCSHTPGCPPAHAGDRDAARTAAFRAEQGWSLLGNGVLVFDLGELLPSGEIIATRRTVAREGIAA